MVKQVEALQNSGDVTVPVSTFYFISDVLHSWSTESLWSSVQRKQAVAAGW